MGFFFVALLPAFLLLIPATLIGMLCCYEFSKHYIYLSTAAPLDRPIADVLREWLCQRAFRWSCLFLLGLLPFVLSPVPHPGHLLVPKLSVLPFWLGIVLALLTCADRLPETIRAFQEAFSSWCTYNRGEVDVPGTFQSPSGSASSRVGLLTLCGVLTGGVIGAAALGAWRERLPGSTTQHAVSSRSPEPLINLFLKHGLELVLNLFAPAGLVIGLLFLTAAPVLADCQAISREASRTTTWTERMETVARSPDPIERESLHLGFVDQDSSPVLLPLENLFEHGWILGKTGTGKTTLELCPLVEWLAGQGRHSVLNMDLKGHDLALLQALREGTERGRRRSGREIPLRYFTNELGKATYAFNPLNQSNRSQLSTYEFAFNICTATNTIHGAEYGKRWFGQSGLRTVAETLRQFPEIASFKELAARLEYLIFNARREVLHNEIRKAGLEPYLIIHQLATIAALNATPKTHSPEVMEHAIDFSGPRSPFLEPQSCHFHLSTARGPGGAAEIARAVLQSLMNAAATTSPRERRCQVFVIIDEWPAMVAGNLEYILQQSRSMGISIILANQSMQDVRKPDLDLLPVLMENCNFRQWFSISNPDDQRIMIDLAGQTVEHLRSVGTQYGPQGITQSESFAEVILPRLNVNDLRLASVDDRKSIVQILSDRGYARYGGFPFVMRSEFHIDRAEYERRRNAEWPQGDPGTFPAGEDNSLPGQTLDPPVENGPIIENETIERPKRRSRRNRGND